MAVFVSVGTAQAFTLTGVANNATAGFNFYGSNGSGIFYSEDTFNASDNTTSYQVRAQDYLIVDSTTFIRQSTTELSADGGHAYDRSGIYDVTFDGTQTYQGTGSSNKIEPSANIPSDCLYPGFHWFGHYVVYSYRYLISGVTWSSWSSNIASAASSGVYGQVCT